MIILPLHLTSSVMSNKCNFLYLSTLANVELLTIPDWCYTGVQIMVACTAMSVTCCMYKGSQKGCVFISLLWSFQSTHYLHIVISTPKLWATRYPPSQSIRSDVHHIWLHYTHFLEFPHEHAQVTFSWPLIMLLLVSHVCACDSVHEPC